MSVCVSVCCVVLVYVSVTVCVHLYAFCMSVPVCDKNPPKVSPFLYAIP